jgi:transcription-repair coupling factor (superfamily II helicase)
MRDLEIRGAGNLLGSQQSGHIAAVGYDLYCRLLRLTVDRLQRERQEKLAREARAAERLGIPAPEAAPREVVKSLASDSEDLDGEAPLVLASGLDESAAGADDGGRGIPAKAADLAPDESGVDLELGVRAFLPESYIPSLRLRLDAYRALDAIRDRKSLDAAARDLRDRFGRPPDEVRRLLDVFLVKSRLRGRGVKLIAYARDRYLVDYTDRARAEAAFTRGFRDRRYVDEGRLHLVFDGERELTPDAALGKLVRALEPRPGEPAPGTARAARST